MSQKRKDRGVPSFSGFLPPSANHFPMPLEFMDLLASITNIAELKIVIYIIRHTWSARQYGVERWITVEEFMFGVKEYYDDGTFVRLDAGTQLCERSVVNGVQKAVDDGYVECQVDDHDRGRIRKYYRLKLRSDMACTPEVQTLHPSPQYLPTSIVSPEVQTLHPYPHEERYPSMEQNNDVSPGVQNIHPQVQRLQAGGAKHTPRTYSSSNSSRKSNSEKDPSSVEFEFDGSTDPSIERKRSKKSIPAFLRKYAEDFSRKFHDVEHMHSNLSQLANIFDDCGIEEESFINCMYEAAEITLKAIIEKRNGQHPNRMPYFFACLRDSVEEQRVFSEHP